MPSEPRMVPSAVHGHATTCRILAWIHTFHRQG
uniref:Uncharacterized protein n=2 Tax=Anguilla anguilla TaxID=7936 RepID=A0A0E9P9K2_ANGAN